ncbi:hypothetical protein [Chitinophaga ginsengisoli]|uniref:Uncharacterized protein n=1 Tax=Chitinophaga ginsengisoli TaxID=363837 RepID=A0A2P8FTE3_9BACT|nr:hypothetical protein [Chitinophaga ginsengisoli]PSL24996.1 hypothetical protein CLV42_114145 [Chitinophaga ginsengisoli]
MGRKSRTKRQRVIQQTQPASLALKIVTYLCLLIGISSLWAISEFSHIDNTRNGVVFFFLFAFLGLILSILFYILIYKTVPDFKKDRKVNKQWSNLFALGLGFFFLTPGIASYINRSYGIDQEKCSYNTIIRRSSSGGRYPEYYLFVLIDNYEERLTVFKSYWGSVKEGYAVRICLQKGILGFEYIKIKP